MTVFLAQFPLTINFTASLRRRVTPAAGDRAVSGQKKETIISDSLLSALAEGSFLTFPIFHRRFVCCDKNEQEE